MKKLLLFAATCFASGCMLNVAQAQTTYTVQQIPYTPYPFDGGLAINYVDDYYTGKIPIGFTFNFFGNAYDTLLVSSNGYVTFDLTNANSYSPWPINAAIPDTATGNNTSPKNAIMGPWEDLYDNTGVGGGFYTIYGTAPNRVFVVSYFNNAFFSCSSIFFTGQIVLHETTNTIDVYIQHKPDCSTWNNGAAIEGIQNIDGTIAYTVPGRNFPAQWTADNDAWRFQNCSLNNPSDTITGRVYLDNNHNCAFDAGDQPLAHELVIANNCETAYTDSTGFYALIVDTGTNTVTHALASYMQSACPSSNSYVVNLTSPYLTQPNMDFADTLLPLPCQDVSLSVGTTMLRKCKGNLYSVYYCNAGTNATPPLSLDVTVPDSTFISASGTPPTVVNGNIYSFSLPYLQAGACGWFHFADSVECDVTLGVIKAMTAHLYGVFDCDSTNNTATDSQVVVASFDPNAMLVASQHFSQRGYIVGETITAHDSLTYQINFQNTGTAPADNIIVTDNLPPSLDPSTVVAGMSSHAYTMTNSNGALTFVFSNINLPDSNANELQSHGFVRFRVKQNPGNAPGLLIMNQASIYFDQNLPVNTNQSVDTLESPNRVAVINQHDLLLQPNPAINVVHVKYTGNGNPETLSVYNALGQLVKTIPMQRNAVSIDTRDWVKGFYMVRLSDGKQTIANAPLEVQ